MADYFSMMRDTLGSYADGVDLARARTRQDELASRDRARFGREQEDWRRADAQRADEDAAIGGLRGLQGGVYPGAQVDWSAPGPDMMGPPTTVDGPRVAGITPRAAGRTEMNQAMQRVALARRDMNSFQNLEKENRGFKLEDDRKTEFKRLSALGDQDLVSLFEKSINASDAPAMVDFDPKTRKYIVVSRIPGIPTQMLSKAEMLQSVMGVWEAGNGDYAAGVQAIVQGAQAQRGIQDKNFERSRGMAKDTGEFYFKGREADAKDALVRNDGAKLGIMKAEADRKAQLEKMGLVRQYQDPKDGSIREFYPVTSKDGVQWVEFERPKGLVPMAAKGGDGPAKEVPAEGTRMAGPNGKAWQADGAGGKLALDGVVPSKRSAVLAKAGFDKAIAEQLPWTPDGKYIAWGGMAYDATSSQDMKELRDAIAQYGADSVMASEMQAGGGFVPRYPIDRGAAANAAAAANVRSLGLARQRPQQ